MTFDAVSDGKEHLTFPLSSGFLDEAEGERGMSPMGLVLAALAGCTIMDVASILRKKRQDITLLEVEVEGTQADEHPKVYTHISIFYRVGGNDIDPAAVERAVQLSVDKYCPVNAMLKDTVEIEHKFEVVPTPANG